MTTTSTRARRPIAGRTSDTSACAARSSTPSCSFLSVREPRRVGGAGRDVAAAETGSVEYGAGLLRTRHPRNQSRSSCTNGRQSSRWRTSSRDPSKKLRTNSRSSAVTLIPHCFRSSGRRRQISRWSTSPSSQRVRVRRFPHDPQERRDRGRALGRLRRQRSTFFSSEGRAHLTRRRNVIRDANHVLRPIRITCNRFR